MPYCNATLWVELCGFSVKDYRTSNDLSLFLADGGLPDIARLFTLQVKPNKLILGSMQRSFSA